MFSPYPSRALGVSFQWRLRVRPMTPECTFNVAGSLLIVRTCTLYSYLVTPIYMHNHTCTRTAYVRAHHARTHAIRAHATPPLVRGEVSRSRSNDISNVSQACYSRTEVSFWCHSGVIQVSFRCHPRPFPWIEANRVRWPRLPFLAAGSSGRRSVGRSPRRGSVRRRGGSRAWPAGCQY